MVHGLQLAPLAVVGGTPLIKKSEAPILAQRADLVNFTLMVSTGSHTLIGIMEAKAGPFALDKAAVVPAKLILKPGMTVPPVARAIPKIYTPPEIAL